MVPFHAHHNSRIFIIPRPQPPTREGRIFRLQPLRHQGRPEQPEGEMQLPARLPVRRFVLCFRPAKSLGVADVPGPRHCRKYRLHRSDVPEMPAGGMGGGRAARKIPRILGRPGVTGHVIPTKSHNGFFAPDGRHPSEGEHWSRRHGGVTDGALPKLGRRGSNPHTATMYAWPTRSPDQS